MSPKLEFGLYKIIAVEGNNLTGADVTRSALLPVRINAPTNIWEVKPQPETDHYRLTLRCPFQFTGVEQDTVVVSQIESFDVNWVIKYHHELGAYSIASRPPRPIPAWTVSDNGEIKIRVYELFPGRDQLFTFEPVFD